MSGHVKTAIVYKDTHGNIRTKHCGSAQGVRDCVSWLRHQGLIFLSKEIIPKDSASKNDTCKRQRKAR